MGAMKRLATEFQLHTGRSLARYQREEQKVWRSLEAGSDSLLRMEQEARAPVPTAGGKELAELSLKLIFTGNKPDKAGRYMVVDLVCDTMQFLTLYHSGEGQWRVWVLQNSSSDSLEFFNENHYRWFFISELSSEDLDFIRKELKL